MLVTSSESAGCVQKNVRSTFGDSDPLPVVFPCSRARSDETHDEGVVTFEISFLVWFRNWTCAFALIVTIEPLLDVPQTITVIPRAVIDEQGATTLSEVLKNVHGVTLLAGEGGEIGRAHV